MKINENSLSNFELCEEASESMFFDYKKLQKQNSSFEENPANLFSFKDIKQAEKPIKNATFSSNKISQLTSRMNKKGFSNGMEGSPTLKRMKTANGNPSYVHSYKAKENVVTNGPAGSTIQFNLNQFFFKK